jgi:uncharacterized integral membrane protein
MHERIEAGDIGAGAGAPGWDKKHTVSPRLIVFVVIAILAVVFVIQNSDKTRVRFLFVDATARVWAAVLIAIALGVVLDRLFLAWWRRRRNVE